MADNQVIIPDSKIIDMDNRIIYIHGDITEETSKEISYNIGKLDDSRLPIIVKINSEGGSYPSVCSIITDLTNTANNVIIEINGVAFSGAAMISLSGDYVKMSKFGLLMLHYPQWETEYRSLPEHKADVEVTQEHFDRVMKELLRGTKLPFDEFKKRAQKDYYIHPNEALKLSLINEIY